MDELERLMVLTEEDQHEDPTVLRTVTRMTMIEINNGKVVLCSSQLHSS